MANKTSAAWQHFVVLEDGKKAKCNHCHRSVVFANGSTGNLFRHMKLRHPSLSVTKLIRSKYQLQAKKTQDVTVEEENKIASDKISPTTSTAPSTVDMQVPHINSTDLAQISSSDGNLINATVLPKFTDTSVDLSQQPVSYYLIQPFDENKQQELNKQLLGFIVKNLIPFNIVENQEFIKFVTMLNPNYALPHKKTLSNDILVWMYDSTLDELKCIFKDTDAVALTAESWISISSEHFIAFTVHYLNKNLELKSNYLQCFSSLQKFSSLDIALFIEELASNWNLCGKILAVVTDNSVEMRKAVQHCNLNHVPSFVHILNEVVETGFADINPFILKIRNVVQYFITNSMVLSTFYNLQKEMGLSDSKLISDISSRWETTFSMFTVFLKNKVPILSTIKQLQLNFLKLSLADFHFLESIINILVIFDSIKIAICSENNFPLSKVLHMIYFMYKHMQNILKNTELPSDIIKMGNTMNDRLTQFKELETDELVFQAVLLDPRFKKRGFPNGFFEEACTALHHNVASEREEFIKEKTEQVTSDKFEQNRMESNSEYFIDMWGEFEAKDPSPIQSHTTAASVEVDAFLNDINLPIEENPLSYWANISNQNKFPALFQIAKRVLCIPASSVPCQQMYSKAGQIFFKKRKHLPSTKIDKILFLYHNL